MADDTRYAYAVARVRGMETRLLDRQWIERLLGETAEGALKALSDSAYQDALERFARVGGGRLDGVGPRRPRGNRGRRG